MFFNRRNFNNAFKLTSVQKFLRINIYIAPILLVFYVEAKFGPLEINDRKQLTSVEMTFSENTAGYTPFDHKRNEEILEETKVETVDLKMRKIQIKLSSTCNKIKQQDAKINAELQSR
jgi:hypothetical protein